MLTSAMLPFQLFISPFPLPGWPSHFLLSIGMGQVKSRQNGLYLIEIATHQKDWFSMTIRHVVQVKPCHRLGAIHEGPSSGHTILCFININDNAGPRTCASEMFSPVEKNSNRSQSAFDTHRVKVT